MEFHKNEKRTLKLCNLRVSICLLSTYTDQITRHVIHTRMSLTDFCQTDFIYLDINKYIEHYKYIAHI